MKIILGSKSPRRQQLVQEIGLPVELRIQEVDEVYPNDLPLDKIPEYLSELKAQPLLKELQDDEILLTSDTIVLLNGKVLGKPKDEKDAKAMIRQLSNNTHDVITGFHLTSKSKSHTASSITKVTFSELTEEEISHYVDTFKPLDKAGSYGIQEWIGYIGVKGIEGCYYNVMGLPVSAIYQVLKKEFGIHIR